jgi:Uma2 family endonuclease
MSAALWARMMPDMPKVELGRPATYDDLVALPDIVVGEIVDDQLWSSPRPAPRHAMSYGALGALLVPAFDFGDTGPGGWRIIDEPELHLGKHVVVPDLGGWRRERMPRLPETAYFPLAPDWVCEVLSPSTEQLDRSKKLRIYAEHGVGHAWLVDPTLRTLEVLRRDGTAWTLLATHAGGPTARIEPFEALEFRLGRLWEDDRR